MKTYLDCFKDGWCITAGKSYAVVREGETWFEIIDDANDEHRFSKDPCGYHYRKWFKLVEEAEVIENVMVLVDELGLQREYREVKRRANVGELIVIDHEMHLKNGEVHVVDYFDSDGDARFMGDYYAKTNWYRVLEQTGVVRIDGKRFEVVARKANVGELVIIVSNTTYHCFPIGSTTTITKLPSIGLDRVRGDDEMNGWLDPENYRVLELLGPVQDEQQTQIDGLTETVANLARRLSEAETKLRVAREDIRELKKEVGELRHGDSTEVMPEPVGRKPLTRDEIIEKAKADVIGLSEKHWSGSGATVYPKGIRLYDAEFVINRKKRVVTCLLRLHGSKTVMERGIAKCAPNDCFNVYIGMAIALRRALGLDIPQEYVNAPKPEEPQVGDVVQVTTGMINGARMTLTKREPLHDGKFGIAFRHAYDEGWLGSEQFKIIDDSRDGRYGEVRGV